MCIVVGCTFTFLKQGQVDVIGRVYGAPLSENSPDIIPFGLHVCMKSDPIGSIKSGILHP